MPSLSGLAARSARFWLLVALAGVGIGIAFWWLFIRPGQIADDAARAKGDAIVADGQAAAARDAGTVIEKHFTNRERIERVTIEGNAAIRAAPGASARIPPAVHAAGLGALCLHAVYSGSPACEQLPDAGAGDDPQADAGSAAAGG